MSDPTERPLVCVVDDDVVVLASFCALLASAGFTPIPYPSGDLLLADNKLAGASCILLDLRMPPPDGMETLRRIAASDDDHAPVVMITGQGDIPSAVLAMQLGAADFREKPVDDDELIEVVEAIVKRRAPGGRMRPVAARTVDPWLATLTPRENEVLDRLVEGLTNKQIARALDISPRTVEAHRASIMDKTRAKSFSQLIRMKVGGLYDVESRAG
jgi:two-component system response regulator FixJ